MPSGHLKPQAGSGQGNLYEAGLACKTLFNGGVEAYADA